MLIFGHPWVPSPSFRKVFSLEDFSRVLDGEIILIEPLTEAINLAHHCQENGLRFAVTVNEVRNALIANALGADYIVCQQEEAIEIQPLAERYLFDAKVLVLIEGEKEIEKIARFSIDGVLFPKAIAQTT